jgi:hypothetical protein
MIAWIYFVLITGVILGVLICIGSSAERKSLKTTFPNYKTAYGVSFHLLKEENGNIILIPFGKIKDKTKYIYINKINDIKFYKNDKEKSALTGALVGGVTFGVLGAIVGSNTKRKAEVRSLGIKVFTDKGVFNLKYLILRCKINSASYERAVNDMENAYNILIG